MSKEKKQAPDLIGGYSYDKVIKNKQGYFKKEKKIIKVNKVVLKKISGSKANKKKNNKKLVVTETKKGTFYYFPTKAIKNKTITVNKKTTKAAYKKVQDTIQYFKDNYRHEWKQKLNDARKTIKSVDKESEKHELNEKEKTLKKSGYPMPIFWALQTGIINSMELEVIDKRKVLLVSKNGNVYLDVSNIANFRLMFSEILDWFFDYFKEHIVSGGKKKMTAFFKTPYQQIEGNPYPIFYKIYFDDIIVTIGDGTGEKNEKQSSNDFLKTVKNKLNSFYKEYFG